MHLCGQHPGPLPAGGLPRGACSKVPASLPSDSPSNSVLVNEYLPGKRGTCRCLVFSDLPHIPDTQFPGFCHFSIVRRRLSFCSSLRCMTQTSSLSLAGHWQTGSSLSTLCQFLSLFPCRPVHTGISVIRADY